MGGGKAARKYIKNNCVVVSLNLQMMCSWVFRYHNRAIFLVPVGLASRHYYVLANVQVFCKISFWLGGRDSAVCVFLNAFHIC